MLSGVKHKPKTAMEAMVHQNVSKFLKTAALKYQYSNLSKTASRYQSRSASSWQYKCLIRSAHKCPNKTAHKFQRRRQSKCPSNIVSKFPNNIARVFLFKRQS